MGATKGKTRALKEAQRKACYELAMRLGRLQDGKETRWAPPSSPNVQDSTNKVLGLGIHLDRASLNIYRTQRREWIAQEVGLDKATEEMTIKGNEKTVREIP